jgi:hypothetical protein
MAIWNIVKPFGTLWSFGTFSLCFGILYKEKSGNPGQHYKMMGSKKVDILTLPGIL